MRYAVAGLGVLVVLGALAGIKWSQIATLMAFGERAAQQGPPAEAVGAGVATEEVWEERLHAIGTVGSGRDVAIRTEVPGVVTRIVFRSGALVRKGDVLLQLDDRVERADLAAALAAERLARHNAERTQILVAEGAEAREELDHTRAELDSSTARVAGLRAVIDKKTLRAPFSGRVGIRDVNVGEYVEAGTTITTMGADVGVFVDFSLPQEQLASVSAGMPVRLQLGERTFEGTIGALEPSVDQSTRAAGLRARVQDGDELLRPGMFVDVEVVLPERSTVVVVPATAIVHAAYGDSVFVLEDRAEGEPGPRETPDGRPIRTARQAFVRTGERRGDFVAIAAGVEAGREVVTAGAFKLRNGSPVYVDPQGAPTPELDPRPEGY